MKKNIFLLFILLLSCNKADSQSIEKAQEVKKPDELKQEKLASEWGLDVQSDIYLTPLAAAATAYDLDEIQRLLDLGADPNYRNKMPQTVLTVPLLAGDDSPESREKQYQVIKLLLENGADPNQRSLDDGKHPRNIGSTPLVLVSGGREGLANIKIAKLLLENGADPDLGRSDNGLTPASSGARPLIFAAGAGQQPANLELAKLLLENGADPNLGRSNNGLTSNSDGALPLIFAVGRGAQPANLELTKLLLEHGADPNLGGSNNGLTPASDGATPIAFAAFTNELEILKLLLKAKPYRELPYLFGTEKPSVKGYSTLTIVIDAGHIEAVRMLLEAGADPNRISEHGTPLEVAQGLEDESKRSKMLALLKEFGAK